MSFRLVCSARVVLEDMVHLFQGAALGLRDEKVGPDSGENAEYGEEDVGTVSCVLN
jgi:hypothetical protein